MHLNCSPANLALLSANPAVCAMVHSALAALGPHWVMQIFSEPQALFQSLNPAPDLTNDHSFAGIHPAGFGISPPKLLLLDCNAAGPDCITLTRKIRALRPDLPIVVMAKHADAAALAHSLSVGVCGCLVAPLSIQRIAEAIRRATEGRLALCACAEGLAVDDFRLLGTASEMAGLSLREQQVLAGLADGLSDKDIGRWLGVETSTVHTFRKRLYRKLGAHNRREAVRKGFNLSPIE